MTTWTLDEVIDQIREHDDTRLSAASMNALHGARTGHPWAKGKADAQRVQEVVCAIAGRDVHPALKHRLDRVARKINREVV